MKRFEQYRTLSKEARQRIVLRYALYQIPDVAIFVLILYAIHRWVGLSFVGSIGLAILWLVKYVIVFSFVWRSYDKPRPGDVRSLIGTEGTAEERLEPSGYVRVHGELWRAEVIGKTMTIEKGQPVRIERMEGLTLLVKPFLNK